MAIYFKWPLLNKLRPLCKMISANMTVKRWAERLHRTRRFPLDAIFLIPLLFASISSSSVIIITLVYSVLVDIETFLSC